MKNDAAVLSTTASDASGHFSAEGLPVGSYTVEASAPGFALGTRLGVPVSGSGSQDIFITLNVDAISQSVTVQEQILLAAETAPMGNTCLLYTSRCV